MSARANCPLSTAIGNAGDVAALRARVARIAGAALPALPPQRGVRIEGDASLVAALNTPSRREGVICPAVVAGVCYIDDISRNRLQSSASTSAPSANGLSRRGINMGLLSVSLIFAKPSKGEALEEYKSDALQYRLLRPTSWEQVEKAGANLLFRDPEATRNTIGVVVNPVKVASLEKFGTLEETGARLLGAERAKDATLPDGCELLSQGQRTSSTGVTIYDYDYVVDTTRGKKRILSTVSIAGSRLYILNVTLKLEKDAGPGEVPEAVAGVVASFDVLAQP